MKKEGNRFKIGVDVGGTFTDLIAIDKEGSILKAKVPTALNQEEAVLNGITLLASNHSLSLEAFLLSTDLIIHGTTIATNSLLEYDGACTGLLTTKGFRDEIELRRGYKESIFNIHLPGPYQIVPRRRRLGIEERINSKGEILVPLNEEEATEAIRRLKSLGVESIAVCFLFSFLNPTHELRVKELIEEEYPNAFVSLSCEVLPQIREFERVSTTVVNSFLALKLKSYLEKLDLKLQEKGFVGRLFIMQSNGGVVNVEEAWEKAVNTILSGPSGGVVAAEYLARLKGQKNIITMDMGGTSCDISLIEDYRSNMTSERWVSRYRIAIPMVDIISIGAGGGSIAWIDEGGALKVGPKSAGAIPGPACYGHGGKEPTVTDADLILGYLNPDFFLGGKIKLHSEIAKKTIYDKIARPLGMDLITATHGIFRIINNNMSNGIQFVSIKRGQDPKDFALVVFGGAGPVHAGTLAEELGIKTIIVPKNASAFSAFGQAIADLKVTEVRSFFVKSDNIILDQFNQIFKEMLEKAMSKLRPGTEVEKLEFLKFIDVRYVGEVHEVTIPLKSDPEKIRMIDLEKALDEFHEMHEKLYAHKKPGHLLEILNARLDLIGRRQKLELEAHPLIKEDSSAHIKGKRYVFFGKFGDFKETDIYNGEALQPGNLIRGPAIIEEPDTTIVIYPDQEAFIDPYFNCIITAI